MEKLLKRDITSRLDNVYGLSLSNGWEQTHWTGIHHKAYPRIVGTYGPNMDVS
jgi:hypothetical protein